MLSIEEKKQSKREQRTKTSSDKLLGLLTEHHNFNFPYIASEPEPEPLVIEIKVASPECVKVPIYVLPPPEGRLTVDAIKRVVCREFGMSHTNLVSERRNARIVRARHVAMYLSTKHLKLSTPQIGAKFGYRDHTTVLHAAKKIKALIERDPAIAEQVSNLEAQL